MNAIIETYSSVSQFWIYPEKDFLANPVYRATIHLRRTLIVIGKKF
jgi:hypothetical protein